MLAHHDAPIPAAPSLDLASGALHATHRCEAPNERFRVGVEAKAFAFENPAEVYRSSKGQEMALSLDLLWETDGPGGYRFRDLTRYEIPCRVSGRIRVGDESIEFVGHGQRDHSWGTRDWWEKAWCWNAGRLDDGTRFHSVAPRTLDGQDIPWAAGYVQPPGARASGGSSGTSLRSADADPRELIR
jgi:hypothetical protein